MKVPTNPQYLVLFISTIFLIGACTFLYGFTSTAADSNMFSSKANPYVNEMIFKDSEQKAIYQKQWFPTQSDQVIFMIVDGLPYNFVVNEEEQKKKLQQKQAGNNDHSLYIPSLNVPFQQFIDNFLQQPNNTVILKGFAHPPTYTSTRIKAIVQGNIPTYDQLKSNLGSKEMKSDNIFTQAKLNNPFIGEKREKIVCYGTHSIHYIYPNIFDRSAFVGEVNFYEKLQSDIDQYQHIVKEQLEYDDWSTMLIHFEAIDAYSHLQRSQDETFYSAVKAVNKLVKSMIDNIRNSKKNTDQVILAVSDHGLNFNRYGRHGGYTPEESSTIMYGFSKTEFITKEKKNIGQGMDRDFLIGPDVFQINITPTYCMLLGIPIPFNNIAMIQPDFFLDKPIVDDFVIANNFYTNFRQVQDSFQNTVNLFDGNIKQLDKINKLGDNLKANYKELFEVDEGKTVVNQAKLKQFIQLCHEYSQRIANVIQTDFQEIKGDYMLLGLIIHLSLAFLIVISIASLKMITNRSQQDRLIFAIFSKNILLKVKVLLIFLVIVALFLNLVLMRDKFIYTTAIISLVLLLTTIAFKIKYLISIIKCSIQRMRELFHFEFVVDCLVFLYAIVLFLLTRTSNDFYSNTVYLYEDFFQRVCIVLFSLLCYKKYTGKVDSYYSFIRIMVQLISIPIMIYLCRYYSQDPPQNKFQYSFQTTNFYYYMSLTVFLIFFTYVFAKIFAEVHSKSHILVRIIFAYFHLAQIFSVTLFYLCQWNIIHIDRYITILPALAFYHTVAVEIIKIICFYKEWLPNTQTIFKAVYFMLSFTLGASCILEYNSLIQVPLYFIIIITFLQVLVSLKFISWISSASILFSMPFFFYYMSGHLEYLEDIHATVFQFGVLDESSLLIPIFNGVVNTLYYFIVTPILIPYLVRCMNGDDENLKNYGVFKAIFEAQESEYSSEFVQQDEVDLFNPKEEVRSDDLNLEIMQNSQNINKIKDNNKFITRINLYSLAYLSHLFVGIIASDFRDILDPYDHQEDFYIPNYMFTTTYAIFSIIVIFMNSLFYRAVIKEFKDKQVNKL
ncbi:hypothetical protein ABPG74_013756 [Tetrahymena malaccensis]